MGLWVVIVLYLSFRMGVGHLHWGWRESIRQLINTLFGMPRPFQITVYSWPLSTLHSPDVRRRYLMYLIPTISVASSVSNVASWVRCKNTYYLTLNVRSRRTFNSKLRFYRPYAVDSRLHTLEVINAVYFRSRNGVQCGVKVFWKSIAGPPNLSIGGANGRLRGNIRLKCEVLVGIFVFLLFA